MCRIFGPSAARNQEDARQKDQGAAAAGFCPADPESSDLTPKA